MSDLPTRVKVGPLRYDVIVSDAAIQQENDGADLQPGSAWAAFSNHSDLVIGLPERDVRDQQAMSLLHEILHCCLRANGSWPNAYAVEWVRNSRNSDIDVEEHTISAMTGALLQVLRENPDVVEYLKADA